MGIKNIDIINCPTVRHTHTHASYIHLKQKSNVLKSIYEINKPKISEKNKDSLVLGLFCFFIQGGSDI